MSYTDNLYLKRIAEKLTSPIERRHTNNYYLKIISKNIGKGGGGSYDDTEIKRRITNVENGKQDKLTAGQNITISGNTITAREIIDDTINSTTTVWSSKKVKDLIEGLEGGAKVSIVATKPDPSVAEEKTMYYVGTSAPFHIWFFVNDAYTDVGTTDINLENYFTKAEINALLAGKVDKVTGKSLVLDSDIAQITTNKNDIADLDNEKVDKETGKSLVLDADITQITTNKTDIATNTEDIADLKTDKQDKITSTAQSANPTDSDSLSDLNGTTNKRWTFAKIWNWLTGKLSTSISSSSTDTQIPSAKAVYTNAIKPTNKTGDDALVISNNNGLTNGADYASNVIRRIIVVGKIAFFTCHLKYTSSAVSANWTEIGVVPAGLRPANRMSVVGMVYNNGSNESVGGNITTAGTISLWTNSKVAGNNYQVRLFASWEIA